MQLSPGEKLILVALADLAKPEDERELDLKFIQSAILDGKLWGITWRYGFLSEENETSREVANETANILTMFRVIESSFAQLSAEERNRVETAIKPYSIEFEGFDGNNDPHHGAAVFMIEEMDRFSEMKGRNMNSHTSSSLPTYRRMLERFERLHEAHGYRSSPFISADEIIEVIRPAG